MVDGQEVRLALRKFELLELLLRNAGRVMTRGQIIDRIWGSDYAARMVAIGNSTIPSPPATMATIRPRP